MGGEFFHERDQLLRKFGLEGKFPKLVVSEAARAVHAPGMMDGRADLRDVFCVTIDPADARDFDDAVSLEQEGEDALLGVYIADVSHFVRERGVLDREAEKRGCSVYLPWRVVPMLPPLLSDDACSLLEGKERKAVACLMRIGPDGRLKNHRIERCTIINKKRLDYGTAFDILEGRKHAEPRLHATLVRMAALAGRLKQDRLQHGSLDFDLPEIKVDLDREGLPVRLRVNERFPTCGMIEEFMLMANKTVAAHLSSRRALLYRVHEAPDPEALLQMRDDLHRLGIRVGKGRGPSLCREIIAAVKGTPEEAAIQKKVLMSMPKARYDVRNIGHFGLQFDTYTHFTSPIRRYPDLVIHRLLFAGGTRASEETRGRQELHRVARRSSAAEENALKAERDAVSLSGCAILSDRIGTEHDGIVSGITEFGVFVTLKELRADGLIHRKNMHGDPHFGMGDAVRVRVEAVNLHLRRIDLRLVRVPSRPAQP